MVPDRASQGVGRRSQAASICPWKHFAAPGLTTPFRGLILGTRKFPCVRAAPSHCLSRLCLSLPNVPQCLLPSHSPCPVCPLQLCHWASARTVCTNLRQTHSSPPWFTNTLRNAGLHQALPTLPPSFTTGFSHCPCVKMLLCMNFWVHWFQTQEIYSCSLTSRMSCFILGLWRHRFVFASLICPLLPLRKKTSAQLLLTSYKPNSLEKD